MGPLELRGYQCRGINFFLEKKKVYLAIDMGLGKTAICLYTAIAVGQPVLIIAPLEVASNTWPDEIETWDLQGEFDTALLHGPNKTQAFNRQVARTRLDIINYDGIKWLYKQLYNLFKAKKPMPYKMLILDESTAIKDPSTDRFEYIKAMRDMFTHIACLSGTPTGNSLLDLWGQYFILDKGERLGQDFANFRDKFFEQEQYRKYNWLPRFGAENAIYNRIADCTFRLQSSDYVSLPERVYHTISVELPSSLRRQYDNFKKDFVLALDSANVESFNQASLNSKLRQFVQGAIYENHDDKTRTVHALHALKVNALKHLVESNPGQNIVCLIQFLFEIPMIKKAFPEAVFITSGTSRAERKEIFRSWNRREIPLLVANPKSISKGLNLQKGGSIMCWYAQTYSVLDYQQANKRLHRTGQEDIVRIFHLAISGTVDQVVASALQQKNITQQKLLTFLKKETEKWIKAS